MRRPFALGALLLAAWSPFLANHPSVDEGNRRWQAGDPEGALRSYQRAEEELGPRPEIDYDRGAAFYRMGRYGEARDAFQRGLGAVELAGHGAYNLGNALARLGDADGAIRAYRRALTLDPGDEDARYNLEVMQRRRREGRRGPPPEEQEAPQAPPSGSAGGGSPDGGSAGDQTDGGRDRSAAQDPPDGGLATPRPQPGQGNAAEEGGQPGRQDVRRLEDRSGGSGTAPRSGSLSRLEAEQLLDAMRERERNMPMRPAGERRGKEPDVTEDW